VLGNDGKEIRTIEPSAVAKIASPHLPQAKNGLASPVLVLNVDDHSVLPEIERIEEH
jgi:hypothetical protein